MSSMTSYAIEKLYKDVLSDHLLTKCCPKGEMYVTK